MKRILVPCVIIITLIAANIELDIYVPALPQMLNYFTTTTSNLQWILSINFIGVAIGSFICGPLSDHFGHKKMIMMGLLIFAVGSLGCVLSHSLLELVFWRFIQGLGSSAPGVIGFAAIAELYAEKKAAQLISIANSVITGSMAAAPIIGNYLTIIFNWRANFVFVFLLATFSLIAMQIFFEETKKHLSPRKLHLRNIFNNYCSLIKNKQFMILGIIPCLMYAALIVYIANLSLLFVSYFGVKQSDIGYYQASIMLTFLVLSFFTAFMLNKLSVQTSQKLGLLIITVSALLLFIISLIFPKTPIIITVMMVFYATGTAISLGPFISEALNAFPKLRGTSSALLGAIRLALSSIVVAIAGLVFNGKLFPIAMIVLMLSLSGVMLFLSMNLAKTK